MTTARNALFLSPDDVPPQDEPWEPVRVPRKLLEAEIERLAAVPGGPGSRESIIVHPRALDGRPSLAPGIRVTLSVLLPGERTPAVRDNATEVSFCIRGRGTTFVEGTAIDFGTYDVWNVPGWRSHATVNDHEEPQVRLTYSNAPLLEALGVHRVDDAPLAPDKRGDPTDEERDPGVPQNERVSGRSEGTFELASPGAWLMPYELLVAPPSQTSRALHWPWDEVRGHLDRLMALGERYAGRRLYLLYNPATGRTNGTTPSFFATITVRPPRIVDRPHRHVSAAINYFFEGSGHSVIGGRRYEWEAGDLMLTAPGWMIHHHASDDVAVYELTVQDQPYHIALESLLWQEDLSVPPRLLGTSPGFVTNREELTP